MPPAITVHDLSKCYRIGRTLEQPPERTVGGTLARLLTAPFARWRRTAGPAHEEFWALRDVSLEVLPCETVGILGRNGAGKSTLLKILSLITRPTAGRMQIHGRVGSLLELGVGFHAELSGRENVFLTGAMHGMRRPEIARKLDDIVAFAGVGQFLDTPIKRYSSGMLARLAFSVASHLENEILIVDEALSVGDREFQARCAARMGQLAAGGRTVLFVSHNLAVLPALCRRGILLERGRLTADGPIADVIADYVRTSGPGSGKGVVRAARVVACRADGTPSLFLTAGVGGRFVCEVSDTAPGLTCELTFLNAAARPVAVCRSGPCGGPVAPGRATAFVCDVDALPLPPGGYRVAAALLLDQDRQDVVSGSAAFELLPDDSGGRHSLPPAGTVKLPHRWTLPGSDEMPARPAPPT
jgi:lipopolysaccharide transport system ATP-binding protein